MEMELTILSMTDDELERLYAEMQVNESMWASSMRRRPSPWFQRMLDETNAALTAIRMEARRRSR